MRTICERKDQPLPLGPCRRELEHVEGPAELKRVRKCNRKRMEWRGHWCVLKKRRAWPLRCHLGKYARRFHPIVFMFCVFIVLLILIIPHGPLDSLNLSEETTERRFTALVNQKSQVPGFSVRSADPFCSTEHKLAQGLDNSTTLPRQPSTALSLKAVDAVV